MAILTFAGFHIAHMAHIAVNFIIACFSEFDSSFFTSLCCAPVFSTKLVIVSTRSLVFVRARKQDRGRKLLFLVLFAYFAKGKGKKKNQYTTDEREMKQMKHKCG